MKRKTTELEKYLKSIGFSLIVKEYSGKHSEHIKKYVYHGELTINNVQIDAYVDIDSKRENVISIGILDPLPKSFKFTLDVVEEIRKVLIVLEDKIRNRVRDYEEQEQIAEIVGEENASY